MDSQIGERALREIYLKPFQIALKNGDPWALMTAYNRVNGACVSEDQRLLQDVLMKEWGFNGLIMSDWTGTYSTVEAIKAGLDLEMPGPSVVRGAAVQRALTSQKLTVEDLDARVRNVSAPRCVVHRLACPRLTPSTAPSPDAISSRSSASSSAPKSPASRSTSPRRPSTRPSCAQCVVVSSSASLACPPLLAVCLTAASRFTLTTARAPCSEGHR